MENKANGQVQLSKFIFSHNWEDPAVDERALRIQEGDTVFTITSGGCNTLGFLRFRPSSIFCVDINDAQTHVMQLKQAAIRRLGYDEYLSFLGVRAGSGRLQQYDRLKHDLPEEGRRFWEERKSTIRQGIFMGGRYEKFVKLAGFILRTIQGPRKTRSLFALTSLEAQKEFFDSKWNNGRWRFIFNTMFNKKSLADKGLNADYFHFDDGSSSFSESFQKRAAHAMINIPARSNYFLALYFLGRYLDDESMPEYLKRVNFDRLKENIDRIHAITADSKYWLAGQPDNHFDVFALSNICELMDEHDTKKLFMEVYRTAKPGARVIFRNLMIPREVPESLRKVIVKNKELSRTLQEADRSFVYGKVAAYEVRK